MLTKVTMKTITLVTLWVLSSVTMMSACQAHNMQTKAALQKVTVVGRIDRPQDATQVSYVLQIFGGTNDNSSQKVVMSG